MAYVVVVDIAILCQTNFTNDRGICRKTAYLKNSTNNQSNCRRPLTCLTNFTNYRSNCRKPLTSLKNSTNNQSNCRKPLICLTNFTNDRWSNCRNLLTCPTKFTSDRSNCRKPLTCLTNFTNDWSNCRKQLWSKENPFRYSVNSLMDWFSWIYEYSVDHKFKNSANICYHRYVLTRVEDPRIYESTIIPRTMIRFDLIFGV